jgi:hypothetical protein
MESSAQKNLENKLNQSPAGTFSGNPQPRNLFKSKYIHSNNDRQMNQKLRTL